MEILPTLIWHYNEPYADSSNIPTYYVSKATRQHVTVALNGDGGDESFAGYLRYLGIGIQSYLDRLPKGSLPVLHVALRGMRKILGSKQNSTISYGQKFLETLIRYPDPLRRYIHWSPISWRTKRRPYHHCCLTKSCTERKWDSGYR